MAAKACKGDSVRERITCWFEAVMGLVLLAGGTFFLIVGPLYGQSQEVLNERTRLQIDSNTRAIEKLEITKADARLTVLEGDMHEVKWLGRAVATALIGQFVLAF